MFVHNGLGREAGKSAQGGALIANSNRKVAEVRSVGTRVRSFLRSGEEGQALVEFCIVAPFLLILLTGLFTFGIAYINDMTLINAVGAGGQQLQTIRTTTTDPCKDTFTAITNAAPGLNPAKITMTLTMNGNSPITNTGTANTCSGDQTELVANGSFTIKAQYPCALAVYGKAVSSNCAISTTLTEFSY